MKNTKRIVTRQNLKQLFIKYENIYNMDKELLIVTNKHLITLKISYIDFDDTFGIFEAKIVKKNPENNDKILKAVISKAQITYNSYKKLPPAYIKLLKKIRTNKNKIIIYKPIDIKKQKFTKV